MSRPNCEECGKPATCLGAYEGDKEQTYSCDDCCGHGCEDGKCAQLAPNGLDPGLYLCEGCRVLIPNNDVFRYFGKLIHEVAGVEGPEPCGEVTDQPQHTCGDHPPRPSYMDCKCCPKCHPTTLKN